MRDSLRALSNEIVARDQNSVVSPISFMRDYSCLQPPLCPHPSTHTVYPSFSLTQRESILTRRTRYSAWRRWYDTWWWNTLMPKVTEKIDWISRFLFEHSLKLFWPRPSDLDRPRFWGVFAHISWVTICRGPLVGSVHGNRRLNTWGGNHKLHTGFISWVKALMRWFKKYFSKKSKFKVGTKLP